MVGISSNVDEPQPEAMAAATPSRCSPTTSSVAGMGISRLEARLGETPLPSSRHDYFQIVLVTRGRGIHVIDWDVHPVVEGAVFALAPASVHCWRFPSTENFDGQASAPAWPIAGYVLSFDAATASCASHDTRKVLLPRLFEGGGSSAFYVRGEKLAPLLQAFSDLEREFLADDIGRTSALQARFQLLLVQLIRACPPERSIAAPSHADALARDFQSLLEHHFRERLSVQHYAGRLNVSEGHLCRMVRKGTGLTATDLIQQRVIVEAKRLLVHLDTNIADIAAWLGYDDPAYFTRLFRKWTAQTPSEFRSTFNGQLRENLHGAGSASLARS